MLLFSLIPAVLAASPESTVEVKRAQYFELSEPMTFHWQAGHPTFKRGTILVLAVNKAMARPRQAQSPTLFVGNTPVAVTHPGYLDGQMVVFVPGHTAGATPVFWADTKLPEQITVEDGNKLLALNQTDSPLSWTVDERTLTFDNQANLYGHIADLIEAYAPQDQDFANGYRMAAEQ